MTGELFSDDSYALDGIFEDAHILPMCNELPNDVTSVENLEGRENSMEALVACGLADPIVYEESTGTVEYDELVLDSDLPMSKGTPVLDPTSATNVTSFASLRETERIGLATDYESLSEFVVDAYVDATRFLPERFSSLPSISTSIVDQTTGSKSEIRMVPVKVVDINEKGDPHDGSDFLFINCNMIEIVKMYLGRAWRLDARVNFYNSSLSEIIPLQGWRSWRNKEDTFVFAEEQTRDLSFAQCNRGLGTFIKGFQGEVHKVQADKSREVAGEMLGHIAANKHSAPEVYLAQQLPMVNVMHLAITPDLVTAGPFVISSKTNGTRIKELAANHPAQIIPESFDVLTGSTAEYSAKVADGLSPTVNDRNASMERMAKFREFLYYCHCTLFKIIPIAETVNDQLVAAMATLSFDDNFVLYLKEKFTARANLKCNGLKGKIGCMVNDARSVMATMEIIKHHGTVTNSILVGAGHEEETNLSIRATIPDSDIGDEMRRSPDLAESFQHRRRYHLPSFSDLSELYKDHGPKEPTEQMLELELLSCEDDYLEEIVDAWSALLSVDASVVDNLRRSLVSTLRTRRFSRIGELIGPPTFSPTSSRCNSPIIKLDGRDSEPPSTEMNEKATTANNAAVLPGPAAPAQQRAQFSSALLTSQAPSLLAAQAA